MSPPVGDNESLSSCRGLPSLSMFCARRARHFVSQILGTRLASSSSPTACDSRSKDTSKTASLSPSAQTPAHSSPVSSAIFGECIPCPVATSPFPNAFAEIGFCFAMALTQFLGEYLISGFSVLWPSLLVHFQDPSLVDFWPASLLSLILCSTILVFARITDMYGGYYVCIFGTVWLSVWSLVAGFAPSVIVLDVCRAMQGLAVAAYTPSCLALFSSIYPNGRRRNIMLGVYGACAPIGFFAGITISAALPDGRWPDYFWISALLAALSFALLVACTPRAKTGWIVSDLRMDWAGSAPITMGLVLLVYALSASSMIEGGWQSSAVLVPFVLGVLSLCLAIWVEGWYAVSPLIPVAFFRPKSVKSFMVASLFLYGTFGVWLFTTTSFLETQYDVSGLKLTLWYLPMAIGGFFIAVVGSSILHIIPIHYLLLCSAMAWIAASLLLALADPARGYWPFPFPAMIAGTLGIDLTFTISIVFLSAAQPAHLQGLAGAMCSILVNIAIAFSLAFAQMVETRVMDTVAATHTGHTAVQLLAGQRAAYWFALGSAAVGFVVIVLFVRIPKNVTTEPQLVIADIEGGQRSGTATPFSLADTLVIEQEIKHTFDIKMTGESPKVAKDGLTVTVRPIDDIDAT